MDSIRQLVIGFATLTTLLFSLKLRAEETNSQPPLQLSRPLDYQVHQRVSRAEGTIIVAGSWDRDNGSSGVLEARLVGAGLSRNWQKLASINSGMTNFHAELKAPAGGWYRLETRVRQGNQIVAEMAIEHVGIGEVFVIAGQSNSANFGEERQQPQSGLVAALGGGKWQLANDPQPGAGGGGGSFIPSFGDAMAERFKVPVGIIATGAGGTSIREWMRQGTRFPNPPTLTGNVNQLASGEWQSTGLLFKNLITRMKATGPHGFRAVLWHQGESDANQADPSRTLPGGLYQKFVAELIRDSRREAKWEAPWFVAQASYHTPDDTGSPEIRAAQQALWKSGIALEGPDTDALTGEFRERGGKGVHFSGRGLREHGMRWAEKVSLWLETQLGSMSQTNALRRPRWFTLP